MAWVSPPCSCAPAPICLRPPHDHDCLPGMKRDSLARTRRMMGWWPSRPRHPSHPHSPVPTPLYTRVFPSIRSTDCHIPYVCAGSSALCSPRLRRLLFQPRRSDTPPSSRVPAVHTSQVASRTYPMQRPCLLIVATAFQADGDRGQVLGAAASDEGSPTLVTTCSPSPTPFLRRSFGDER